MRMVINIAVNLSTEMRDLLLAMNLGHSTAHPLAGWDILMMLYQDGTASTEPMTRGRLVRTYNQNYLDSEIGERLMTDNVMGGLLQLLNEQARLIEVSNRKVRERWQSGKLRVMDTAVYRISSRGIEYVKMLQRVIEAENTVVANTERIGEYCDLVVTLSQSNRDTTTTTLYNNFDRLLVTYDDVMKGMRKLDVDLHDLATDLAFNHGSDEAQHLKQMLSETAIPAYRQLLRQAARIRALAEDDQFAIAVARSRQGAGNIDAAQAIQDTSVMTTQRLQTTRYVSRQLKRLAGSFDPSTSGMQNSFDSIYLVFQTLMNAINLLTREMAHRKRQTVDLVALTGELDGLLQRYQRLRVPVAIPRHLPMDRHQADLLSAISSGELSESERAEKLAQIAATERQDLLEAGSMPSIQRQIRKQQHQLVSESDNPEEVTDDEYNDDFELALAEFNQVVMQDHQTMVVDHDLTFRTTRARNVLVELFPAVYYDQLSGFDVFGRSLQHISQLADSQPVRLKVGGEAFSVTLPFGFEATLG